MSDAALGAVVMAAGAGRRMGGRPKCLLQRDGVSLLARTVQALVAAGVREVAVVLGHHAARVNVELDAIEAALPRGVRLHHALNPSPDDGPGSSLRCGLAALPGNLDAVVAGCWSASMRRSARRSSQVSCEALSPIMCAVPSQCVMPWRSPYDGSK